MLFYTSLSVIAVVCLAYVLQPIWVNKQGLSKTWPVCAVTGVSVIFAAVLYMQLGAPNMPNQPISLRLSEKEKAQTENALIDKLEKVLRDNPKDIKGWLIAARVYMEMGDYAKAAQAFATLIALDPASIDYKLGRAESLILEGKRTVTLEAQNLLADILRAQPQNLKARFYQGFVFEQNGETQKALQTWKTLIEEAKDNPALLKLLRLETARLIEKMEAKP